MHFGYFDGACKNNPGRVGLGASILNKSGEEICSAVSGRPHGTNNDAEYLALILLLQNALKLNIEKLTCFGDSKLVVNQVNRTFNASEKFKKYLDVIDELACKFIQIEFKWIKREKNKRADELSKLGLKDAPAKNERDSKRVKVTSSSNEEPQVEEKSRDNSGQVKNSSQMRNYSVTALDEKTLLVVKGSEIAVVKLDSMTCSCKEFKNKKCCVHINRIKESLVKYSEILTAEDAH